MEIATGWRTLTAEDLAGLCGIAGQAHAELPERAEVLAEKLRLFPEGCLKYLLGGRMAGYGLARARGLAALALVSVYGTSTLWARFGFRPVPGPDLASYGPGAEYMVRKLGYRGRFKEQNEKPTDGLSVNPGGVAA